jgi:hypothetical protein
MEKRDDGSGIRCNEHPDAPHGEPVAWANSFDLQNFDMKVRTGPDLHHTVPLYTAPTKREWVGLTDDDYEELLRTREWGVYLIEAVENKLKEKNHG